LIETAVLVLLLLALGTDAWLVRRQTSSYEFDRYKVSRRYSNLSENSAALTDVFPVSSVLRGQPPCAFLYFRSLIVWSFDAQLDRLQFLGEKLGDVDRLSLQVAAVL
jgi:hypothetical protein